MTPEPAAPSADITPEEPEDEPVTEEIETITHPPLPGTTPVPYEEFTGSVTAALDATTRELVEGLRAIVAIEGPVLGHRLHSAYVRASGGQKVGKLIANALNRAVTSAVPAESSSKTTHSAPKASAPAPTGSPISRPRASAN